MKNTYFPTHNENRMRNEGDVEAARAYFMTGKNRVLYHLIEQRFSWMNDFINQSDQIVIELGCGAGLSKFFIHTPNLILTDVDEHPWVDKYENALEIDYPDESIDVVICSHMIHHISNPASFFDDLCRKLKPGGRIIIQDIYTSSIMKLVLRIMRHEGWSDTIDIYDRKIICNDPVDPWSANCSIPKLMFFGERGSNLEEQFPAFRMLKRARNECFLFLTSGGVIAKTHYLPVGDKGAKIIKYIDKLLVNIAPSIFACGCSVVLEKKARDGANM